MPITLILSRLEAKIQNNYTESQNTKNSLPQSVRKFKQKLLTGNGFIVYENFSKFCVFFMSNE